jgi:hypothetical protein
VWVQYSWCEPPREIVVGSGSRFAYWGENLSNFGNPSGTFTYMGPLPAAGGWRRLEIPAAVLDLENEQVTELLFGAFDGKVWFDRVSRMPQPPSITSFTATSFVEFVGDVVEIDWTAMGAGTLEYQVKARNRWTGNTVLLMDWSTTTSYDWTTTDYGQFMIELYVRNAYSQTRDQREVQVGNIE